MLIANERQSDKSSLEIELLNTTTRTELIINHLIEQKFVKESKESNPSKRRKIETTIIPIERIQLDIACFNAHGMNQSEDYANVLALNTQILFM